MSRHLRSLLLAVVAISGGVATAGPPAAALQPAESGTITGRVTLTTRARSARLAAPVYPSRTVPTSTPPPIPEIHNVVVYLKGVTYRGPLQATTVEMRQTNETFVPHVLAITRGSTVNFSNGDPFFHNVFSLSRTATFDLGRYPEGKSRSETFSKPGLVKVYCRIHSQMSAAILVLDHPFFSVPNDDGTFTLRNVPPGDYTIVGWHERVGERAVTVHVEAGKTATVDLTLPVEDAP